MDEYLTPLQTPCVYYDPSFLPPEEASAAFTELLNSTPWEKSAKINRWVTLMELPRDDTQTNEEGTYKYRDAPGKSIVGFPPVVYKLKLLAEEWYNSKNSSNPNFQPVSFNICLLNYYPTPSHRLGWHSDREELGRSTPIASISLGCPRTFLVRSKTDGMRDRTSIRMENGSLVLMENICQRKYLHSVPKEDAESNTGSGGPDGNDLGRINLTFRCKDYEKEDSTTPGELEHERRDHWIDAIQKEGGDGDVMAGGWKADDIDNEDAAITESKVFGDNVQFYDPLIPRGSVEYVVKTNIGAECYSAAELEEVLDVERYIMLARPFGVAGYVAVCLRDNNLMNEEEKSEDGYASDVKNALLQLRTAHHILRYHDHFDLEEVVSFSNAAGDGTTTEDKATSSIVGEDLYQYYKDRLVSKAGSLKSLADLESGTFRVTSDRVGKHGFQAPEVEREMGGALSEYYPNVKPKMNDFDINVRIDIIADKVIIGTQLNIDDISKERHFLRFRNAVTIKTNLAYAMIRCANIKDGDLVCDPFCGSGNILLEALDYHREQQIKCIGMDVSRRSANGAKENALAEGFEEDIFQFNCCDARNFRKHLEEDSVSAIITNMPWAL